MPDESNDRKNEAKGNLADFFAASPLRGSGLVVRRDKRPPRLPDLGESDTDVELPPASDTKNT